MFAPSLSSFVLTVRFKDYRTEIPPRDTIPYKMRTYPQELDVKANHTVLIVHRAIMFHSTQGYWLSMSRGFSVACRGRGVLPNLCAPLRETEVEMNWIRSPRFSKTNFVITHNEEIKKKF